MTRKLLTIVAVALCALLGVAAGQAAAQFKAEEFDYGSRFKIPDGQEATIWNPAKRKLLEGGPMVGGTVRSYRPPHLLRDGCCRLRLHLGRDAARSHVVGAGGPLSGARVQVLPPPGSAWHTPTNERSSTPPIWALPSSWCQPSTRSRKRRQPSTGPTSRPWAGAAPAAVRARVQSGVMCPAAIGKPGTTTSC